MAKKRGKMTPKTYIRFLQKQLEESRKQQSPFFPPGEIDPGRRAILGMKKRKSYRA